MSEPTDSPEPSEDDTNDAPNDDASSDTGTWSDLNDLADEAEKDPQGFEIWQDTVRSVNEEKYPDGDGEE